MIGYESKGVDQIHVFEVSFNPEINEFGFCLWVGGAVCFKNTLRQEYLAKYPTFRHLMPCSVFTLRIRASLC